MGFCPPPEVPPVESPPSGPPAAPPAVPEEPEDDGPELLDGGGCGAVCCGTCWPVPWVWLGCPAPAAWPDSRTVPAAGVDGAVEGVVATVLRDGEGRWPSGVCEARPPRDSCGSGSRGAGWSGRCSGQAR